jgi:hypothetical protein
VIAALRAYPAFINFSEKEGTAISTRDGARAPRPSLLLIGG